MFVTNLEPRKIRGFESNGMLFAVSTPDVLDETGAVVTKGTLSLLEPETEAHIPSGTRAK
jgi:tRNA-binding EMAP/Myf-like protein